MTSEKNNILIYFNDVMIATTSSFISYEREASDQKEYLFTNLVSGLSATIFSNDIVIIENNNIQIDII